HALRQVLDGVRCRTPLLRRSGHKRPEQRKRTKHPHDLEQPLGEDLSVDGVEESDGGVEQKETDCDRTDAHWATAERATPFTAKHGSCGEDTNRNSHCDETLSDLFPRQGCENLHGDREETDRDSQFEDKVTSSRRLSGLTEVLNRLSNLAKSILDGCSDPGEGIGDLLESSGESEEAGANSEEASGVKELNKVDLAELILDLVPKISDSNLKVTSTLSDGGLSKSNEVLDRVGDPASDGGEVFSDRGEYVPYLAESLLHRSTDTAGTGFNLILSIGEDASEELPNGFTELLQSGLTLATDSGVLQRGFDRGRVNLDVNGLLVRKSAVQSLFNLVLRTEEPLLQPLTEVFDVVPDRTEVDRLDGAGNSLGQALGEGDSDVLRRGEALCELLNDGSTGLCPVNTTE